MADVELKLPADRLTRTEYEIYIPDESNDMKPILLESGFLAEQGAQIHSLSDGSTVIYIQVIRVINYKRVYSAVYTFENPSYLCKVNTFKLWAAGCNLTED